MSAAAIVLVCALDLLGRSERQLPPIRIIEAAPAGVSKNADAFVARSGGGDVIYLISSAPAFRAAEIAERSPASRATCSELTALKIVASIIVHEEWHVKHGSDERSAYEAQLTELNRLGLGGGTWPSVAVTRSMRAVLKEQQRQRAGERIAALR